MTADTNQGDAYTRNPNWIFDLMPVVTPAQFKVIAAGVRLTYGWHQEWTDASAATVSEMTGIARPTVTDIFNLFTAVGLFERAAGNRNSYRWRLCQMAPSDLSSKVTAHLSSKVTGDDVTCHLSLQPPVILDDSHLSSKVTSNKDERKSLKERKERERAVGQSAPASRTPETSNRTQGTATVETEATQQSARTPSPSSAAPSPALPTGTPTPASAGQAPRDVEQPRLVDAELADALTVYRQVAGVRAPNQAQRAAIREHVTSDLDLWREACDYFARNGFNVRKIDNVIDRYQKAVKTRRAEEMARKEAEERRRQATAPREEITPEQWERIRAAGAELKAKLARQQAEEAARPRYEYLARHRARAS